MHNSVSILKATVYFKWVNCLGYESYLNETVSKKKKAKEIGIRYRL